MLTDREGQRLERCVLQAQRINRLLKEQPDMPTERWERLLARRSEMESTIADFMLREDSNGG